MEQRTATQVNPPMEQRRVTQGNPPMEQRIVAQVNPLGESDHQQRNLDEAMIVNHLSASGRFNNSD